VSVRCTPRYRFAAELAVFVARAQTQLRTVLATGLRPSLRLGYTGTRHGSDARFSGSALLNGVRHERKGAEIAETRADIWGRDSGRFDKNCLNVILLLDNVITTGTTFMACRKLLLDADAAEVVCFALGKAIGRKTKETPTITGVRLKVEQNQLVGVCWRFGSRVIELQGA
jgi:hypothetical protein